MRFPQTNKISQPVSEVFGENAKTLETHLLNLNWRVWFKSWAYGLIILCVTLFSIVASVRLALVLI